MQWDISILFLLNLYDMSLFLALQTFALSFHAKKSVIEDLVQKVTNGGLRVRCSMWDPYHFLLAL